VGFIVLILAAVVLAVVQHGELVRWPWAPDLPLALVAWTIVAGNARSLLVRAWLVGAMRDIIDPASLCFHAVAYTLLAVAFLPVRAVVYRGRGLGWAALAFSGSLILRWADRWWIGLPPFASFTEGIAIATTTALAALFIGWLLGGLPTWLRPVASGEADRQLR